MPAEKADRRSQRTRRLLADALVALMNEERYDAITVQDIIDRADVGRTTFYAHFKDKEDLLLSEIERVVHQLGHRALEAGEATPTLLPSLALLRHVRDFRPAYQAIMWGRGHELIITKIQGQLTGLIEQRLAGLARPDQPPTVPLPVLARFVGDTFLTLLKWWMEDRSGYTPEAIDEMFWRLVKPTVQSVLKIELSSDGPLAAAGAV